MTAGLDIFVALHGQDDNLGDSALRRALVSALRGTGRRLHVLVGHHGGDYVAGLGLADEDVRYRSRADWQRAAVRSALAGRSAFVSNAGEIQLNRRRVAISLADAATIAAVRLRGGVAVQTGIGIRRTAGGYPLPIALAARGTAITAWRDEPSRAFLRFGEVAPDWAFALPAQGAPGPRTRLAVSMRGDRPAPSDAWVAAVRELAARLDAATVVTVQVKRDGATAAELAARLGADLVDWPAGTHADQERRVRDVYARSAAVVSDRLHALVLGVTEGAAPLALVEREDTKIARTFAGAGFASPVVPLGHPLHLPEDWEHSLAAAREGLADLTARMVARLQARQRS